MWRWTKSRTANERQRERERGGQNGVKGMEGGQGITDGR